MTLLPAAIGLNPTVPSNATRRIVLLGITQARRTQLPIAATLLVQRAPVIGDAVLRA